MLFKWILNVFSLEFKTQTAQITIPDASVLYCEEGPEGAQFTRYSLSFSGPRSSHTQGLHHGWCDHSTTRKPNHGPVRLYSNDMIGRY